MKTGVYNFNYEWKFKLANVFPLKEALKATEDEEGRRFYEREYAEDGWEEVSLPHTYNDRDLFVKRIEDAGGNQLRTFSCYRKWFFWEGEAVFRKAFLEFEGIRQTCYLYVNGTPAGYYEAGIAPFGFDITPYLIPGQDNLIAVATDSTSSRNMDFFCAETPNLPGAEPGSFYTSLTREGEIPEESRGLGFFWNCNDFNPCVGGLSKNVRLHVKPVAYLTLPLYRNLRTKGVYVYGSGYDIPKKSAVIHVQAEVRNESEESRRLQIRAVLCDQSGKELFSSFSEEILAVPASDRTALPPLSVVPSDAYRREGNRIVPAAEDEVKPTDISSSETVVLETEFAAENLRFWSHADPYLYTVRTELLHDGEVIDRTDTVTGFRKVSYDKQNGIKLNDERIWLTGYAQRSSNEWPAVGAANDWLKDQDARWIRESNANHIRFMHVAGCPADIRSYDRYGVICTQPAGDKERENFGRQWDHRVEAMRDVIIYFRNSPSILFWEAGNNSIGREHMREMRLLKERLDPNGGRFMGCRTINTKEVIEEAEYVGTMLNRHAARFMSERMPVTETEYLREEAPRRIWDDFTPPDYDYDCLWLGAGGRKQPGGDYYDLTSEDLALLAAKGYAEFFHDRVGGASGKNLYTAAAALCWTDSAQHGRQAFSENARMSGRMDPIRIKKQSFHVFHALQSEKPEVYIVGHWNYPQESCNSDGNGSYRYALKEFDGTHWKKTGEYGVRNPKDKTVYVIGSYPIARVELYINGNMAGVCENPNDSFVFAFPHIDITQSGEIRAVGYAFGEPDVPAACHRIETAGDPAELRLTLHTGEEGLWADGADVAYVDIEVLDSVGRLCPLCDRRIGFSAEGEAVFLGGYNSGRFNGFGRHDSVIHQMHVYAECGLNRVFVRSTKNAGPIRLTARMEGIPEAEARLSFESVPVKTESYVLFAPQRLGCEERAEQAFEAGNGAGMEKITESGAGLGAFKSIPEADRLKYKPSDQVYCKVLVNGQEPDTHGILSIVDHGSIYSPILYILERLHSQKPEAFSYSYDSGERTLVIESGGRRLTAQAGRTHLIVDGEENLMNGQPYMRADGVLIVEINAVIGYIQGISAQYDELVNVFRIEW